jgi:hypothetical protein
MRRSLQPCPSCAQHVRAGETRCPFCDASLPSGFGARSLARGANDASGRPRSRAALLFVGATAAAACGGRTQQQQAPAPSDGGGDAATSEADSGPSEASSDASTDAPSDATDSEDALYWGGLGMPPVTGPPEPVAGEPPMAFANYGPAVVGNPMSAALYGPATNNNVMPSTNGWPEVIGEPATSVAAYGPGPIDTADTE